MIRVQTEDFDIGAEVAALTARDASIGGVAVFVGLVRDMLGDGTPVKGMTLEHYPGMTERQLQAIVREAQDRWPIKGCRVIHRFGRLEPGDRIVLVAVASAHRQAAIDACAFLMDWLKTKAPFWKREETPEGALWVEARREDDEAAARWAGLTSKDLKTGD